MLSKKPETRPDAHTLVSAFHALAAATEPAPASSPSNRVSRLLRVLAFGTPIGVFLLIGLGFIVIEHFLPPPPQATSAAVQAAVSPPAADTAANNQPPPQPEEAAGARAPRQPDAYLAGLDKKLVELRVKRAVLLTKYTTQHPDVVEVDRQLEQLRIERSRYLKQKQRQKN